MYCSSCGAAVANGLSYCNHCGAKLTTEHADTIDKPAKPTEVRAGFLIWAMVAVLVFGLVGIVFLMMGMKMVGFHVQQIFAFTILSFLIMLMVESACIWQLVRRARGPEESQAGGLPEEQVTKELDGAHALPELMPSVTEHTTRALNRGGSEDQRQKLPVTSRRA